MSESEIIFLVDEAPEGGFVAKAVGHSIFTEAPTLADLHEMVRDAVICHFDEGERPKIVRLGLPGGYAVHAWRTAWSTLI